MEYILFEGLLPPTPPPPLPDPACLQASFQPVLAIDSASIPTAFAFSELACPVGTMTLKIIYINRRASETLLGLLELSLHYCAY